MVQVLCHQNGRQKGYCKGKAADALVRRAIAVVSFAIAILSLTKRSAVDHLLCQEVDKAPPGHLCKWQWGKIRQIKA